MELRHFLRLLLKGWWIIALTTLAAMSIALTASYLQTPMYRASARLVVRPNQAIVGSSGLVDSLSTLDKPSIVATYVEVLRSNRIYSDTVATLQMPANLLTLYTRTTVQLPATNILEVSVEGPDPQIVATMANTMGQRAIEYIKGLYQVYGVDFLDAAILPTIPVSPQPLRDTFLAAFLGLVLGSALAILGEQIRTPLEAFRRRNMFDTPSSAYTQRYFYRHLEEELPRSQAGFLSLGIIRLDGLQGLIDTLPQPVVQRVLRQVTRILQAELRGNDCIGRWSDITFALLLPSTPGAAAVRTLERIQQALIHPLSLDDTAEIVRLDPRIGVVAYQGDEPARVLVERAETALERAEQAGKSPILFSS